MILRRDGDRSTGIGASAADFYAMVHWGTDLKARGKIVAGAMVDPNDDRGLPEGFLILNADTAEEAERIAESWPVKEGVRIDLRRVVGNF